MPELTRREIGQVVGIGLVVLAISSIPCLLGYRSAAPGTEFGGFVVDLDDSYSYLAAMQQGLGKGWRYQVLFTPEEHRGIYLHTFYLGLGKLSSLLGFSLMQMYQLARVVCGLSLLITAYMFLSLFLEGRSERLVAYLLISFSSGLGWVVLLSGSSTLRGVSPIDFWLMDAYTFFIIFTFPHSAAAVTLLLLFFILASRYRETYQLRALLGGCVVLLPLCLIHPFTPLLVDGVLAAHWALLSLNRRKLLGREATAVTIWALAPLPILVYYFHAFTSDPVLQNWAVQNFLPSPPATHLLLGYGIVFLLAVGGAAHVIQQRNERRLLLVAWVISAVILLYVPFTLQRRMVEGLHIPLCVLATIGLFEYLLPVAMDLGWLSRFARWRGYQTAGLRRFLLYSIVMATIPSNLYLLAGYSASALSNDPALYYGLEEVDAVDWLGESTERTDTVLASYRISRYIPARVGNRVFMGHFHETVQVESKKGMAESFFEETTSDDARRAFLAKYGISYVFHGPRERLVGEFDPSRAPYLTPVFDNASVQIYSVKRH